MTDHSRFDDPTPGDRYESQYDYTPPEDSRGGEVEIPPRSNNRDKASSPTPDKGHTNDLR